MGKRLAELLGCMVLCLVPTDRGKPSTMHSKNGGYVVFQPNSHAFYALPPEEQTILLLAADAADRVLHMPDQIAPPEPGSKALVSSADAAARTREI